MPVKVLGIDLDNSVIKLSLLKKNKDKILLKQTNSFSNLEEFDKYVTDLREGGDLYIVSSLPSVSVLVKKFQLPLTKKNEIEKTLPFQLEGVFPYKMSDACVAINMEKLSSQTNVKAFATPKKTLKEHLKKFGKVKPDFVTSEDVAIAQAGKFLTQVDTQLCIHLGENRTTLVATAFGEHIATSSFSIGYHSFYQSLSKDLPKSPKTKLDEILKDLQIEGITRESFANLFSEIVLFKKECERSIYYLLNTKEGRQIESFIFTGHFEFLNKFKNFIETILDISLRHGEGFSTPEKKEISRYAISFGSALEILQKKQPIEFRQTRSLSPYLTRKLKAKLLYLLSLSGVFTLLCFGIGSFFIKKYENQLERALMTLSTKYAHQHPVVLKKLSNGSLSFYQKLKIAKQSFGKSVKPSKLYDSFPIVSQTIEMISENLTAEKGLKFVSLDYDLKKYPALNLEDVPYEIYIKIGLETNSKQKAEDFGVLLQNHELFSDCSQLKISSISGNRYEIEFAKSY